MTPSRALWQTALMVLLLALPARAGAQLQINPASTITVQFQANYNQEHSEISYAPAAYSSNILLTPDTITIPVTFTEVYSSSWGNGLNWDGTSLALSIANQFAPDVTSIGTAGGFIPGFNITVQPAYNTCIDNGPTEKTTNAIVAALFYDVSTSGVQPRDVLNFIAPLAARFNVTIPSGKTAEMDQSPIILENLTIAAGGLAKNGGLTVRHDFLNAGAMTNVSATVGGDLTNTGFLSLRDLSVTGLLINPGEILITSGTLTHSPSIVNPGTLALANGRLSSTGDTTNTATGKMLLKGGANEISGKLINHGALEGWGSLVTDVDSDGTFFAAGAGQQLHYFKDSFYNRGGAFNNQGVLGAAPGATLSLGSGTVITQTPTAEICAEGEVEFGGAIVNGGKLTGAGVARVLGATFNKLACATDLRVRSALGNGLTLGIIGGELRNDGRITVNESGTGVSRLAFGENTVLSGAGEIVLNNGILEAGNATVTLNASHTLRGAGSITAKLVNQGAIRAEGDGRSLNLNADVTNNSVIQSQAGATLSINSATITQGVGGMLSCAGAMDFVGANIIGGAINGLGVFQVYGARLAGVTSSSELRVMGNNGQNPHLVIGGGLFINHGEVILGYNGFGTARMTFEQPTLLEGIGVFTLRAGGVISSESTLVTLSDKTTIRGSGIVSANLELRGVLVADDPSVPMRLGNIFGSAGGITSSGLIACRENCSLILEAATLTQQNAARIYNDGTLTLSIAALTGGEIAGFGGVAVESGSMANLRNKSTIHILGGSYGRWLSLQPGFINDGCIIVNSNGTSSGWLDIASSASLSGIGTVVLMSNGHVVGSPFTQAATHTLSGNGSVDCALTNNGCISPGIPVGSLNFTAPLTLGASSVLDFHLDGTTPGVGFDTLTSTSSVQLGGALKVTVMRGFQPNLTPAHSFRILQAASVTGSFTNLVNNRLQTNFGSCLVSIDPQGVTLSDFRDGQTWHQRHFSPADLADPAISGDDADPNHNGLRNLLEYAMDADPGHPGTPQFAATALTADEVTLTYRRSRSANDVLLGIEQSTDMKTWTPAVAILTPGLADATGEIISARIRKTPGVRQFFRLRAQRLP